MILNKFPPDLEERKCSQPNVIELHEWLIDVALVHHQLIAKRSQNLEEQLKHGNWITYTKQKPELMLQKTKVKISKNKSIDQGLCCNKGKHSFWNFAELKMIKKIQRYDVVKKQKLFFGCLGNAQCINHGKVNPWGIDGCDRKHNRLLQENRPERRPTHREPTNFYSMPCNRGLLPIKKVRLKNPRTSKSIESCALQDTGSRVTLIQKILKESLRIDTKGCKIELAGAKISISITERITVKVSTKSLKPENTNCLVHSNFSVGSMN